MNNQNGNRANKEISVGWYKQLTTNKLQLTYNQKPTAYFLILKAKIMVWLKQSLQKINNDVV